jgi:putative transposase
MPRAARVVIPTLALHIVQRGHNRTQCFFGDNDYSIYLDHLALFSRRFCCAVHAYCLMTNHVHLFLTPGEEEGCARMMKYLGQCYAQHVNKERGRTGSLWEGRFRSALVASERYAIACYRYIELNPVRAGMVTHARDYRWSSHGANAGGAPDGLVAPHPAYLGLGEGPEQRRSAYRGLFADELDRTVVEDIRKATRGGYLVGSLRRPRGRQMRKIGSVPI